MPIPPDHRVDRRDQLTLLQHVVRMGRGASDGALALCAGAGLTGAALLVVGGAPWWMLAPLFLAVAMFGLWGIVDRIATERGAAQLSHEPARATRHATFVDSLLVWLRLALVLGGIGAAAAAVLLPLAATLGNVVH